MQERHYYRPLTCVVTLASILTTSALLGACASPGAAGGSKGEPTNSTPEQRDSAVPPTSDAHPSLDATVAPDVVPRVCTADAATRNLGTLPPSDAASPCPPGYWQNSGTSCGPFSAPCRPDGDGLCYRICATSDDCPDPCAAACFSKDYYSGGDTPSGRVPVCGPGVPKSFPAECVAPLRACFSACETTGLTGRCAEDCFDQAKACGSAICTTIHDRCVDACYAASSDPEVINACVEVCIADGNECLGPF